MPEPAGGPCGDVPAPRTALAAAAEVHTGAASEGRLQPPQAPPAAWPIRACWQP